MILHGLFRVTLPCIMLSILAIACKGDSKVDRGGEEESSTSVDEKVLESNGEDLLSRQKDLFAKIDRHARSSADVHEIDIASLAQYLGIEASSDIEKARAIYVWLTENVIYDDEAFNTGSYGDYTAQAVLRSGKAVCEGFSNLYQALGQEMGLDIRKVSGYAKGYGYAPGQKFRDANHAWNAIQIDGQWRIYDATWGQGNGKSVGGKLVSEKTFDPYWFDLDPYKSIFDHFPEKEQYSFVTPQISLSKYERLPKIDKSYFEYGFDGKRIYEMLQLDASLSFPKCFQVDTDVAVIVAPEFQSLQPNLSYDFVFDIPAGKKMALIDASNEWTFFEKEGNLFSLNYLPDTPGDLKVSVQYDKSGQSYGTLLLYQVDSQVN